MSNAKKIIKKQEVDLTKARDERCIPVAKQVLSLIANYDYILACDNHNKVTKSYAGLTEQILKLFLKKKVKASDIPYIFRLLVEPVDKVSMFIQQSLNHSLDIVVNKAWQNIAGKDEADVDFSDLDKILKEE